MLISRYFEEMRQKHLPTMNPNHAIPQQIKHICFLYYQYSTEIQSISDESTCPYASEPSDCDGPMEVWRNDIVSSSANVFIDLDCDLLSNDSSNNSKYHQKTMLIKNLWNGKYSKRAFMIAIAANII